MKRSCSETNLIQNKRNCVQHNLDLQTIELICADNMPIIFQWKDIKDTCTSVLARLLGKSDGFSKPEMNEKGQLIFLQKFGISSTQFAQCLAFLRSGYISNFNALMSTMMIIGGSNALDALAKKKQEEQEEQEEQRRKKATQKDPYNPICPEEDFLLKFRWVAQEGGPTSEWDAVSKIENVHQMFWWRKLRNNDI